MLLNGNLFKTSADFLPKPGMNFLEMAEQTHKYWNPSFTNSTEISKYEYLFQGKLEIIKKLK